MTRVREGFRRNWWRLVFAAVGTVAAVVSYGHIVDLFLSWHAPLYDARLMPIAIDGLIIIGAGAARSGQVGLGWSAIGPGLAASLYANVMNGLPHGPGAAAGSGWATIALFLATNVMERWKPAPAQEVAREPARGPDAAPEPVPEPPAETDAQTPPADDAAQKRAAHRLYRRSVADGKPLGQAALGKKFGRSKNWGRARIAEVERARAVG